MHRSLGRTSRQVLLGTICALLTGGFAVQGHAQGLTLYVAPEGNDAWSGKVATAGEGDGPFASLQRARDEIRALKQAGGIPAGGVTVQLAGGVYELSAPLSLEQQDSGTEGAPIVYRAKAGDEVRLVGGKQVTNFEPVTDPEVLARLAESARGFVMQADLKALGVTDLGTVSTSGQRLEVFFQDRPMSVSRWPNEGFVRIVDLVGGAPHKIHGIPGDKIGRFVYDGDRPTRWVGEKDLWLHGYWFWDWAEQRQQVESIDTEKRIISLKPPYHGYGYRKNQWYYAFNALCELDCPGEWYLDHESGMLYFWPPAPLSEGKTLISVVPSLITMNEVSFVTVRGLILEASRATAVTVSGGTGNVICACVIRNTGGSAVSIGGGTKHGVVGCDVYETADGGIHLTGGDRTTLTPAEHYADNNHVHHYSRWNRVYRPGITLHGVGNRATHNLIDNAPHMAMGFGGNDHLIEFNELHSVCYESNDAGAIYTGRDWSMRGTVIRHNYLHHINGFEGRGCVGVYLDDQFSGTLIYGNLFHNVTRAAMIGGGRDCTIENNVFVDCVPATHVDSRGLGWAAGGYQGLVDKLENWPYKEALWAARYPQLPGILDDEPMAPKGNLIARNVCVGGRWGDFDGKAKPLVTFEDNLIDEDPHFVDREGGNYRLRDDSPAYKIGFKPLPIEQMGLYESELRASWPVKSDVRPMAKPPAPAPAKSGTPPVAKVAKAPVPVTVDGEIKPEEWNGAKESTALVLEQGFAGEKVKPRSLAWLAYDDTALYVAIANEVDANKPISTTNTWGQDDAVEVAIRNPGAGETAPILVLRGYPNGHLESSDEAGASPEATRRAAEGVQYKAQIPTAVAGRWTAEFAIPFASLGIDPAKHKRFQFNLSARKAADELWLEWESTRGCTWQVDQAGFIELVP